MLDVAHAHPIDPGLADPPAGLEACMDTKQITDRLREELRKKLEETSMLALATKAGVPRTSLREFVDGGNRIQLTHAAQLCDALGIRLDLVLFGRLRRSRKLAKTGGPS